jgi:hypothetical protein
MGQHFFKAVLPEYLRQHDLAGHQALGRQHTANRRQGNQPADAADPLESGYSADAHECAIKLADAQELERRYPVA